MLQKPAQQVVDVLKVVVEGLAVDLALLYQLLTVISSKNFFCSSFFNAFAKASLVLGANRLTSHRDSIEAY